jgi:NAD(P)H-dependent flavin oxidoreductase YrpB (nitropropane dioxygenase family)
MTHPSLSTRFTDLVGVRYPIVQTGMGWVATSELTAATSNAGGLGILAASTMSLDELRAAVADVRRRTTAPFGVNLRADQPDVADRVDLLVREGVRVASFAMAPREDLIARLHDGGVLVMPSIGAKRHAEKVAGWGVDAVLVQGGEGGGHTGSVPTSLLLPQVVDAVGSELPIVAAGGYFDGRGLVAALAYGASGIAMGTRFLLTSDSSVPDAVKAVYLSKSVSDTVVTRQVDGVPHRVLRSELVDDLEASFAARRWVGAARNAMAFRRETGSSWRDLVREGRSMRRTHDLSWSQVLMAGNTPMLLRAAMVDGRVDLGVMASGQVVGVIDDLPSCAHLVDVRGVGGAHPLERVSGTVGDRFPWVVRCGAGGWPAPATSGWCRSRDRGVLAGQRQHAAASLGDLGVVGGDEQGGAGVGHVKQPAEDDRSGGPVLLGGRFVGEQDPRVQRDRAGDRHPLLLTARELLDELVGVVGEPELGESLGGGLADGVRVVARRPQRHLDVLGRCEQ